MDILFIVAGFVGLVLGGEALVRGAVALAERLGIPPLVIGLTLVGFGTSMPELVTSVQAALSGAPGIAIGNVVGSNSANILLIIGLSALIAPLAITPRTLYRDGGVMLAASIGVSALMLPGEIGLLAGAVCLTALAAYIWIALRASDVAANVYENEATLRSPPTRAALFLGGGLIFVIGAAKMLVLGAVGLATDLGVSEAVIGLTVVAVGTSLPELVTSVIAVRRGQADVAIGNVIGSNIFNLLGILGATALIAPLPVPAEILRLDLWVMLAATAALMIAARSGWRIRRGEGALLLAGYAIYMLVLF